MKYQAPTFTLPASNPKTTQENWDLATLSRDEFRKKYNLSDKEYEKRLNA
jgi:hypothetical protein